MDPNMVRGQKYFSILLVLQDECFGKNYSSFLDFTHNYERKSGIFVPWWCYKGIALYNCNGNIKKKI